MAAKTYYFTGPVQWAKIYTNNRDEYGGNEFTSIDMFLDEENKERFIASGSQLKIRSNDEGQEFVKFRRNWINPVAVEWGGPPEVVDKDNAPFDELVGNGSICTIRVVVYDTKMGKGTRMEKVRVDEHVVYEIDKPEVTEDDGEGKPAIPF